MPKGHSWPDSHQEAAINDQTPPSDVSREERDRQLRDAYLALFQRPEYGMPEVQPEPRQLQPHAMDEVAEHEFIFRRQRQLVRSRLELAFKQAGYTNPTRAKDLLGDELWAAIHTFWASWERLCSRSCGDFLNEAIDRLAEHLVRVSNVPQASLIPPPSEAHLPSDIIGGRDLAYLLAKMLGGDADMTPVAEVRYTRVRRAAAIAITQDVLERWTQAGTKDKAQFKRVLMQRLEESAALLPRSAWTRRSSASSGAG